MLPEEFLNGLNVREAGEKWKKFLKMDGHHIFVACQDNEFVGFTSCNIDREIDRCIYLDSLHITKDARGKGIGSLLLATVGKHARENGYQKMSVCIVKGNDNAGRLYQKMGAKHYKNFVDDFEGTKSQSEKLVWTDLANF
ncbi:GNAT family N-acetyltransferase [Empedobacter falsenii]